MGHTLAIHWAVTTHGAWLHGDIRGSWRDGRLIGPDPYLEAESRARLSHRAVLLDAEERVIVAGIFGDVVREQQHRVFAATIRATHVHLVLAPLRGDLKTVIARLKRRSAGAVLARRRELAGRSWLAEIDGSRKNPAKTAGPHSTPAKMAGADGEHSRPILGRSGRSGSGRDPQSVNVPRSLWTSGQFPVFVFDEGHVVNAIEYVRDHNRRVGLPPDPFDWIDPLFAAYDHAGERHCRSLVWEQWNL